MIRVFVNYAAIDESPWEDSVARHWRIGESGDLTVGSVVTGNNQTGRHFIPFKSYAPGAWRWVETVDDDEA